MKVRIIVEQDEDGLGKAAVAVARVVAEAVRALLEPRQGDGRHLHPRVDGQRAERGVALAARAESDEIPVRALDPSGEVDGSLGVFDGEIRISEKETPQGTKQTLKIRRLYNQKYLENEIVLTKERLSE
jgi:hypothetical protein